MPSNRQIHPKASGSNLQHLKKRHFGSKLPSRGGSVKSNAAVLTLVTLRQGAQSLQAPQSLGDVPNSFITR
eukprot:CAMPEP_0174298228 /NCGR_PEP_ID=MMETSP0809-20121228/53151_1 /TAXON_ID=73025 ORGANISM="Eutreptiella gymnastica-like, Strain CCMP1594" /NCGR_SAMPLE_ID=MMETSP0809 /ASSEMBLY_ACC=CAM_ASM_000658 /LENGTH=70 /DNA_ID=CAMNT_0015402541 /DNA_START=431 /DNA_END=639 /DNA_ORIENTATION=-